MIHGKGLGGKHCSRVGINLTNRTDSNLKRLSISCDMPKAEFIRMIIERFLSNSIEVHRVQEEFNVNPAYWVTPVNRNGEVELVVKNTVHNR